MGPSYTIRSHGANFWRSCPPQCATLPHFEYGLQSRQPSSKVAISHLWNPLSELRGSNVFANVKSLRFFGRSFALGRTSDPRSIIKVIAHHSRLGRTFWHLIHGSVAKTAGGVARRSLVRANSNTILECTFPEENVKWCLQWQKHHRLLGGC